MARLRFTKMHGAGNDYVYVDCFANKMPQNVPELAIAVSDRHKGIGAFIVHKDAKGVKVGKHEDKLGQRASGSRRHVSAPNPPSAVAASSCSRSMRAAKMP